MFKIIKKSKISKARIGLIETPTGRIETPFFMPDATFGQVRGLTGQEMIDLGLECFVVNALHLYLRPGLKIIKQAGGLAKFINWPKPILSDSGGYQVFSLIHRNARNNGEITDRGAVFKSPLDGSTIKLTPEISIRIQFALGAEMIVCFDDCPPNDFSSDKIKASVDRTIKWAKRCRLEYDQQIKKRRLKNSRPLIIAVVQGGNNLPLREYCAGELIKIGFDGFGFGARHIDQEGNFLNAALNLTARQIPENKLRFGLGIGLPEDMIRSIKMGYDMFDCVIPTREGRHGKLFFQKKHKKFYHTINITNAKFAQDNTAINDTSTIDNLRNYSKAYLHYLFKLNEPLGARLASLNNLEFYLKILSKVRRQIKKNEF